MPHIIVKMHSGRSEMIKKDMADRIAMAVAESLNIDEAYVSVALEETEPEKWNEEVYKPDIIGKEHTLYKKPGYTP